MNVLIVGSGGREHALAWKIRQSRRVSRVFVAPGNAGTALDAENVDISAEDVSKLVQFARENRIALTVVGPESPLCRGIVDAFEQAKLRVFGPSKAAAQLEGSKVFCKHLLRGADVPSPDFHVFRDTEHAHRFIVNRYPNEDDSVPLVVKADGLAAGKGVMVCSTRREALDAIERIMRRHEFGDAGREVVIEERLDGQEASVLAITDGRTLVTLPPCQDHKRALDGDLGRATHSDSDGPRDETSASAIPWRAVRRAHAHAPRTQGAGI
jgi:phosphoribosylamine--glycine ligase